MGERNRARRILHLDLTPFFVGVERARDPELEGKPVIVGGEGTLGMVAAASLEAQRAGVRAGQSVAAARRACPSAILRPGDLESYSRLSDKVTSLLLTVTPRVLRPSADEAIADLSSAAPTERHFVLAAESLRDALQTRLGLKDVALGLASTRLGARLAARWARPRGLLLLVPAHEQSLLSRVPIDTVEELSPGEASRLRAAGVTSLAAAYACLPGRLASILGRSAALRLLDAIGAETAIPTATPPSSIEEEALVRDPATGRAELESLVTRLAGTAVERLRPFALVAGRVQVDVRRAAGVSASRSERLASPSAQPSVVVGLARRAATPLIAPAIGVRSVRVRLLDLQTQPAQAHLFPEMIAAAV